MGSSTGSMFYAFGAFLILYLVGASIYQIFLWIRKWREKKENDIKSSMVIKQRNKYLFLRTDTVFILLFKPLSPPCQLYDIGEASFCQ